MEEKREKKSMWKRFWKWFASELFRKRIYIKVIGGQNLLASYGEESIVLEQSQIKAEAKQGIYIPNYNEAKKVYFLGFTNQRSHTRSVGKAAAGAIVGGVLTGGIGAVAGAAIGARKRNTSTALLDFEEVDTGVQFTVEIECDNNKRQMLNQLPVASR